jgi:molybdenum cofactor synthesis domain-containing protein
VKTAGVLVIGDEVLSGEVRDENGPWLVSRLSECGARVVRVAIVPDRLDEVVDELVRLRAAADVVLVSGGIGPTHDDVTRPAVARALGVPLERHAGAEARVRSWYGEKTTDAELTMAMLPTGSRLLRGKATSTLGFAVAGVYVLPGVPSLLRDLVEGSIAEFGGEALHREEVVTALREGEIADDLSRIQSSALDVAIGSYPTPHRDGSWTTRVVVRAVTADRARSVASEVRAAFSRLSGAARG